jgi:phage tail-like protein
MTANCVAPITVYQQSDYMRHLPALYEEEGEFIGRFLMLFESFWAPVEHQIEHIDDYFDLKLTPLPFLRWLATWFDLDLPEHWAEERQRRLLAEIVQLYRLRGTRSGLQRYLELVTGGQVQITEYSAYQFRIGAKTRLGAGVAVGRKGRPHTFAVQLTLPHLAPDAGAEMMDELERLNRQTRLIVEQIIEAEKPAHTAYSLSITYAARG